jgi:hypothetical protein
MNMCIAIDLGDIIWFQVILTKNRRPAAGVAMILKEKWGRRMVTNISESEILATMLYTVRTK